PEQREPRVPPRGPPEGGARHLPPGGDVPPVLPAGHAAPAPRRERNDGGAAPGPEGDPGDARDHAEGARTVPRAPTVDARLPAGPARRDGTHRRGAPRAEGPLRAEEGRGLGRGEGQTPLPRCPADGDRARGAERAPVVGREPPPRCRAVVSRPPP